MKRNQDFLSLFGKLVHSNDETIYYDYNQSCTQIGRTVCLYTVLPDFQEKILLKRAVE